MKSHFEQRGNLIAPVQTDGQNYMLGDLPKGFQKLFTLKAIKRYIEGLGVISTLTTALIGLFQSGLITVIPRILSNRTTSEVIVTELGALFSDTQLTVAQQNKYTSACTALSECNFVHTGYEFSAPKTFLVVGAPTAVIVTSALAVKSLKERYTYTLENPKEFLLRCKNDLATLKEEAFAIDVELKVAFDGKIGADVFSLTADNLEQQFLSILKSEGDLDEMNQFASVEQLDRFASTWSKYTDAYQAIVPILTEVTPIQDQIAGLNLDLEAARYSLTFSSDPNADFLRVMQAIDYKQEVAQIRQELAQNREKLSEAQELLLSIVVSMKRLHKA